MSGDISLFHDNIRNFLIHHFIFQIRLIEFRFCEFVSVEFRLYLRMGKGLVLFVVIGDNCAAIPTRLTKYNRFQIWVIRVYFVICFRRTNDLASRGHIKPKLRIVMRSICVFFSLFSCH